MGTLSGGGKQVNSIGQRSLLGANAGIGISLGDDSIVIWYYMPAAAELGVMCLGEYLHGNNYCR